MYSFMKRKQLFPTIMACVIVLVFIPFLNTSANANKNMSSNEHSIRESTTTQKSNEMSREISDVELTNDEVARIAEQFMEKLVQETDRQGKVVNFDTKQQLIQSFHTLTHTDVAKEYVDFYYKEYNNGLYIIPTETPPWFQPSNAFQTKTLANGNVQVVQHNQSDLYGDYTIALQFGYEDNQWKIVNIQHK
ncbi:hypothetical protein [Pontibacillus litoralis]|uniref:DUF3993 domain-containing protein n=1 Tax=Pontibacillus litoralis JSM 072002 TaxID=1385512 RepID=A0A0A5HT10_9BACI|nr:hypothetical protein [Pontibacillus litoralis]KGX86777.1 hypothetical protein N784_03930 [Pontibacillus litoralis JSM 072002]